MEKNRYFSHCVPHCSLWLLALFFFPIFSCLCFSCFNPFFYHFFPFFWLALQKLTGIASFSSTDMWTRTRVCVIVVVQTCHSVICPEYFRGRQLFILAKWWEALKAYSVKKVNYKRTTSVPDLTQLPCIHFSFFALLSLHHSPLTSLNSLCPCSVLLVSINLLHCIVTNVPRGQLSQTELFYLRIEPLLNHIYKQCI